MNLSQLDINLVQDLTQTGIAWVTVNGLNLLAAIVILAVGYWISKRIANLVVRLMERRGIDLVLIGFFRGLVLYALMLGVVLASVSHLGIDITSFLAIVGSMALALALAVKDNISNFSSGVVLILFRPFTVGDYVQVAGVSGTVQAITLSNTILTSPDNQKIIVPNNQIMGNVITNVTANPTRRIDLVIGVSYDADLKKTSEVLMGVIKADPAVLADPEPVVAVAELADSSVNFNVRPWVKTGDYWTARWRILEAAKEALDAAGIGIPYPQHDVHLFKADD